MAAGRVVLNPEEIRIIQQAFQSYPYLLPKDGGSLSGSDSPEFRKEILLNIQNTEYKEQLNWRLKKERYKVVPMTDFERQITGGLLQNYRVTTVLPDKDLAVIDKLKKQMIPNFFEVAYERG